MRLRPLHAVRVATLENSVSLEGLDARETRTEQVEDAEHVWPLLQHLSVNYEHRAGL